MNQDNLISIKELIHLFKEPKRPGLIPHAQRKQARAGQAFTVGHYPAAQGEALRMLFQGLGFVGVAAFRHSGLPRISNERDAGPGQHDALGSFLALSLISNQIITFPDATGSSNTLLRFSPFSTFPIDSVSRVYINYTYMQNSRHEKSGSKTSCNT